MCRILQHVTGTGGGGGGRGTGLQLCSRDVKMRLGLVIQPRGR